MVGEYLEPIRWIYSIPKLLSRTLLWTLSRATPGSFAHPRGAPIQRSMLLPRALGLHPESSGSPSQTNSPQHLQPLTLLQAKTNWSFPSLLPLYPGTLTRDSKLSPGPGANGPRCRRLRSGETWLCCPSGSASPYSPASKPEAAGAGGAMRDAAAQASPGAADVRSPTCSPRPRRGPKGRLAPAAGTARLLPPPAAAAASTAARAQHASQPRFLPPLWLQRPTFRRRVGATTDPTRAVMAGCKKKGDSEWKTLTITSNTPAGGLSWKL